MRAIIPFVGIIAVGIVKVTMAKGSMNKGRMKNATMHCMMSILHGRTTRVKYKEALLKKRRNVNAIKSMWNLIKTKQAM